MTMDRRGGNDSSNFFNRIKNVDVLRSPFPRHLAQSSRQPAMASSTRPVISGYSTTQQTARPTPLAAPLWQTPVPRPGSFNVSPLGSYKRAEASARMPASPAFYRPPAEYPSSVQPIRVRSYPANEYRQIPGSTIPMHIASGLSSRNLQPGTLCCVLRNWFVCIDMEKLAVTVSGSYTKPNGIAVARHSSPIDIAIERRTIVATSGTMYQLVDAPDLEMMRMKGMPEYLVSQFADGFPRNWKQLVEEYLGISSEVRRGRGDLALRGEEAARTPTNGYLHHDYRSGLSMSNRFQPIAEDSEALASISPISPPSSVSISGYSGTRQQMSPSVTAAGSQRGNRKSVYRSGMDIFATDRFSRTRPAQKSEAFEPEHQKQAVLAEVVETRAEALSPVAESQTRSSTEMAMETPLERTPMARADTDLQNQIAAISMETPTKKPAHSSSLSPELGVAQISSWKSSHTNSTIDDLEPFKLDDDFESSEPGQTSSEPRMANPNLKPSQATTTPTAKPTSKKTRKLSRKIIESSDEFLAAPEDTGEESKSSAQELVEDSEESRAKSAASTAKRTYRKTPASANSRLARRTPKSAPKRAAKSDKAARRSYAGLARSINVTPTKQPKSPASEQNDDVLVIIERPSKPRQTHSSQRLRAGSNAAGSESGTLPPVESSSEAKLEETKRPRKSKGVVRTASPAKQSQKKTPETPKPTTPKRKLVKQEPDKTPEAPASVTRSGRKVRKPQEWWANAQEHLGSTYKGSDIKYHWGKGDAIIIRDGKRYRLSDVVLDGDNAEPLSSSHKGNTDEALDDDEHGK